MQSQHELIIGDARQMDPIQDESVDLVVTSPPYPMIQMWDTTFASMSPSIGKALDEDQGSQAFELMHQELDRVWQECARALKSGGTICVNIGDAVRTIAGDFQMYSNHARVISAMSRLGMTQLPDILWRKQTNAPNKFMGSGMLPVGAYVTYEHEYILIFRKGNRRTFKENETKHNRRISAFFWEERNRWFSDIWEDLKGSIQGVADPTARQRSAAYPFELAYRLICMHSTYGDTVLDPFLGTGTTTTAALAAGRNSIGVEIDAGLRPTIVASMDKAVPAGANRVLARLCEHQDFVDARLQANRPIKHRSSHYGFPVITSQERDIVLFVPFSQTQPSPNSWTVHYESAPAQSTIYQNGRQGTHGQTQDFQPGIATLTGLGASGVSEIRHATHQSRESECRGHASKNRRPIVGVDSGVS